ncbi:potassium/sodium hyperpolarization-activated cyclic nucleotide-gated channel 2 [Apis cerana]|uniref:potassium/sodium hyperpolarization-activated cyclic nucleotide-gated channel 2 n=1 Tax=Apis cerana TaxID=7461 RepID=UPI002B2275CD|nr:potassium/sodium hyperpolarization-activated cyclic nucleotide-gated channel 2 [Apis cerana]
MLDHVCTLKIPDDDKKLSFGERWSLITQISRKTPRAKKYFDSLHFEVKHYAYELFSTLMLAIFIIYWFACLYYLIPVLTFHLSKTNAKKCADCWMIKLDNNSKTFRFRCALFMVVDQISASGYGHLVPYLDDHIILNCILLLIGRLLEFYIAVMIIRVRMGIKEPTSKFQEIINQLFAYVNQKQLPKHIKIRLVAYYYHRFRKNYFREKTIMLTLSEHLRQEIALESCHRLVENVSMFRNVPKSLLRNIVKNLKFELYLPNDVIVKAGAHGDCMFFLSAGTVAVLTPTGKEICHLDDGAHFGEIALLVPDQRRVASVIAIEVCEVYRLNRKDFRKCIAVHSELFAMIESIATERIERAVVIEEQHKRYLMRDTSRIEDKKDMPHL